MEFLGRQNKWQKVAGQVGGSQTFAAPLYTVDCFRVGGRALQVRRPTAH